MIFQRWNSLVNAWQLTDDKPDGSEEVKDGLVTLVGQYLIDSYHDVRYYTMYGDRYAAIGAFVDGKIVLQIDITRT